MVQHRLDVVYYRLGFGNVVNNYANQGLVVVSSRIFIFALYFIPYALIVGQLGSTFKEGKVASVPD